MATARQKERSRQHREKTDVCQQRMRTGELPDFLGGGEVLLPPDFNGLDASRIKSTQGRGIPRDGGGAVRANP
jgi:hypothetical protein